MMDAISDSMLNYLYKKKYHTAFFLVVIAIQLILTVLFAYEGLLPIVAIVLIAAAFYLTAFSVEKSFYLFAAYFLVFPDSFYSGFFPGVPIAFLWILGYLMFLVVCFYWIIDLLRHRTEYPFKSLDKMLIIFMISVFVALTLGVLRGYRFAFIRLEIMPLSLYLTYFIVLRSSLKENPGRFYDFVTLCAAVIALEFVDSLFRFGGRIFLVRVVSMHIHVALLGIAYICTTLIYSANRKKKILMGFTLPVIIVSVIISQQRAMWGAAMVVLILAFLVYVYHRREKIITISLTLVGILGFLFISYLVVDQVTKGALHNTLMTRGVVLMDIEETLADESYKIRANEVVEAIRTIKSDFLIGKGIGASIVTRWRFMEHATVDNSYAYLYWKMGIFGLMAFVGFYLVFFVRSLKLLTFPIKPDERIFVIATLLNFVGLFIVAFTNVCIVHYRFILIWAASIGFVEYLVRKYE